MSAWPKDATADLCGEFDESGCDHDPACGFAMIGGVRYCHAEDHSCYMRAQERLLGTLAQGLMRSIDAELARAPTPQGDD